MMASARRATLGDVAVLERLMHELYAEAGLPLDRRGAADTFARLLQEPARGAAWLLESGGECAGYVVLSVGFSMEYGGLDAFVDDLYVRPRFRRQGVGRLALATLFAECERRGVGAVHLEVERRNHAAKALYARFGFRDKGRELLTARLPRDPDPA